MRTWVEIDKKALEHNLFELERIIQKPMWLMIKSNAYGHGAEPIVSAISMLKAQSTKQIVGYGVSNGAEAIAIRKIDPKTRIAVFADSGDTRLEELLENDIEVSLTGWEAVERVRNYQGESANRRKIKAHLKIETGLNRYGFKLNEISRLKTSLLRCFATLNLVGIYSHFSAVEEGYTKFAEIQLERFLWGARALDPKHNLSWHIAATAAALNLPQSRLDQVRIGIGLYGLYPATVIKNQKIINLKPVLSWKSKISSIHQVNVRDTIGYGNTFKVIKPLKVAVVPVGYADGYDRHLSNKGEVLIGGVRRKIVGRVFMNTIIVDITNINPLRDVNVGDEVVLVGRQGEQEITIEELAQKCGTINYEVVTRINWQIPRVVV